MEKSYSFNGLFLTNFTITLGVGMADAFFSLYLFSLGGRGLLLGLPLALYSAAKICFSPLLGRWSDRVGRRFSVASSLCLYLVIPIGFLLTHNLILLAILRLLQGLACALLRPVMLSLVGEFCLPEQRSKVMGTFDISFYAALSLGPVIGGMIKDHWGFTGIFLSFGTLALVALACAMCSIPAGQSRRCKRQQNPAQQSRRSLTIQRTLYGLYVFIYARACGISLLAVFLPILLTDSLALDATRTGVIMASGSLVMALVLRPLGCLADHTSRYVMLGIGATTVPLLYFLIPSTSDFEQILLLTLLIGLFSSLSQPAASALLIEHSHTSETTQNARTFTAILNLGFFSGPLFGAALEALFGLNSVFYAAGMIGLVSVPIFICLCAGQSLKLDLQG